MQTFHEMIGTGIIFYSFGFFWKETIYYITKKIFQVKHGKFNKKN
jgi:hypothetical protein